MGTVEWEVLGVREVKQVLRMPPERDDQDHQDDSAVSRSYYEDRYKTKDRQSTSDSHRRQDSAFWDAYGYGLRDNYGYGSQDHGYDYNNYYPSERILGGYSDPCSNQLPGYRQAIQDPSFALGLFVIGALATYILYGAINTAGIGKKKRNLAGNVLENFWSGLEEFEEKVDKIAEGQDTGDSWISQIFNQFAFLNDVDNQLTEDDLDGIEPPILDETWGLGIRNSSQLKKIPTSTTVEEPVKIDNDETVSRKKREVKEEAEDVKDELMETEEKCRVDMWRCLSKVVEGGLHYIDNPDGLYGLAKKTMFKVAFHGGFSNMWSGLMTIPEARQIKQCMNTHTECIFYEILRREAQTSMDPSEPGYQNYKMKEDQKAEGEKARKRERLIINPEFVESLDQGDGAQQFDEDYYNNEV